MKKQNWDALIQGVISLLPILPKSISHLLSIIVVLLVFLNHKTPKDNLTLAEYIRLQPGMSVGEAQLILGRGVEIEQSTESVTFIWKNPNGSKITVIFQNGKLIKKQQTGL